jgi:hypothetical protein
MTFVNSDILIAGYSSLSYSASFLRQKGIVLYIPFHHVYSTKHIKLESDDSIIINKEKILNSLSGRTLIRDRIEGPEINKSLFEERVTPITMTQYWKPDLFLSCGENCLRAFILKYLNLRDNSYLFDWASCEKFKILPEILSNTLEHHIENNIINNNNVENIHLYNFGEGEREKIIYIHHPDKEYQKRVSKRFFDAIHSSKKICFLYTYGRNNLYVSDEEFDSLINIIIEKYPNLDFRLFILKYNGEGCEMNLVRETSYIKKYEYKTTTRPPWISEEIYKCEAFREVIKEAFTFPEH